MRDELTYAARRVFAEFIDAFEKHSGQRSWMLSFEEDEIERMGLTHAQVEGALDLLESEGLIESSTMHHCELTDRGYRACRHRELIDEILGPPQRQTTMVVIQAQQVAIGDNNYLQANSDEMVAALIELIKKSDTPEPTKARWIETLKDVAGFAIAEGLKMLIEHGVA